MKLLFVAKRFPFPLDAGGKIRTAKLLESLSRDFDITLVSNVEHPRDDPYLDDARKICGTFVGVPWTETPKYSARFYVDVARRIFSKYPISVASDYSEPFAAEIRGLLAASRFDVVVCDFVQPSVNLHGIEELHPVLLFQHNVESVIFRRHAETAVNPLAKWLWRSQWRKMEAFERDACRRSAGVVAVSEGDRAAFDSFGARRTFTIPTAVDPDYFRPAGRSPRPASLIFIGSMDWLPNEDAVLFFVDEIMPRIASRVGNVSLKVVGRNPSARIERRLQGRTDVVLTGRVEDIRPHVDEASACVVPLRIGGGTRIKIYEAMAMGKAIVSTSIGAEGLPVRDGEHLAIADTPAAFAGAVADILLDDARRGRLERAGRLFVETHCSWRAAAAAFGAACHAVAGARELQCT